MTAVAALKRRMVLAAVVAGTITACGGGDPDAGSPLPVVLDYSPTTSDVTALLYLAQHPGVDLRAVTLAGTGESRCPAAVPNTRALLDLVGLTDVPVACGSTMPIGLGRTWPYEWRAAADELGGLDLPPPAPNERSDTDNTSDAVELLVDTVADSEGAVIVALGPLTNLAEAIRRHPSFVDDVTMLYTMGGALDVAGNAPNGTAEWNYAIDPTAVSIVVDSDIPLTLVPLDATDDVPVDADWFAELQARHTTPAANAVHDLFEANRPWDFGFYFWDELTAAIAVDESLAAIADRSLEIVIDGDDAGRTLPVADGDRVRVAAAPDVERFRQDLLMILNTDLVSE